MRSSKKFSFLILPTFLVLLAMFVSACGGGTTTNQNTSASKVSDDKQIFRYPIGATDFSSLDPALVQLATDAYSIQTIFTGLVQFNDQGGIVDQLAASHQVSADGLTYTFTLRSGLKFSDGSPLTAQDVAYSINRTIVPATASQVSYYISLIKDYTLVNSGKLSTEIGDGILVPDDHTVQIILSKPAAYFLQAMTYPCTYVVEKKLIDQYGKTWTDHLDQGGGDGPYKVVSYSHTKGLIVDRNPNYYGKQPQLREIQFLISGATDTTYKAYLSGQFDFAGVPPANLAQVRADNKLKTQLHDYSLLVIRYLTMNYLAKPFDNIHIRQAFALAINKDLLVSSILRSAVIPTNHIIPSGMQGYNANLKGPDGGTSTSGNATLAKQLLQQGMTEAGYASVSALPTITFSFYTDNSVIPKLASALIQEWQVNLGITVQPQAMLFGKLIQLEGSTTGHAGPLQLWIAGWQADYPDPQDWLSTFFNKSADYNNMNYGQNNSSDAAQQQQTQQQMAAADVNLDQTSRITAYNAAEQQVVNDVAWIPLYQSAGHALLNPKLQGYTFNGLNITAPDDWANIYFTQ